MTTVPLPPAKGGGIGRRIAPTRLSELAEGSQTGSERFSVSSRLDEIPTTL